MDDRVFDVPRYLSVLPLFSDLGPLELQRLAAGSTLSRPSWGELVFQIGEPCNGFHVIVTGQVKLFALSPTGQEKVIAIMGDGQSFGEAVMFTDQPHFLSAQVLTDAVLLNMSTQTVIAEIERNYRFALRMLAGLSRRLHGLVQDVEAHALRSGLQRVIGYLLRDQGVDGCEVSERCTVSLLTSKATIASRLSLTPEYFSRVLHELEAQGLIEIDRRDIRIPDTRRLSVYQFQSTWR